MLGSYDVPYRRWHRRWNKLTGNHTHSKILHGAFAGHRLYIKQLEIVPPFARCELSQLMWHPTTGVYWAMYAEDWYGIYEPLAEVDAFDIINRKNLLQARRILFYKSSGPINRHGLLHSSDPKNWSHISQLEIVPPFTEGEYNQLMQHRTTGDYWAMYAVDKFDLYEFVPDSDALDILNEKNLIGARRVASTGNYGSTYRFWWRKIHAWIGKHTHWRILHNVNSEHRSYIKQLEIVAPFTEDEQNQVLRHPTTGVYWAMYCQYYNYPTPKATQYRQYEPLPKADASRMINQKKLIEARRIAFRKY